MPHLFSEIAQVRASLQQAAVALDQGSALNLPTPAPPAEAVWRPPTEPTETPDE